MSFLNDGKDVVIENNIIKGPKVSTKCIDRTIGEALFDVLSEKPDHVAQIDSKTGEQTTFKEMKDKSARCSMWMNDQDISEDDIIVTCSHNHLDTYVPVFATFMVEAVYTAWDPEITEHSARQLIKFYKPKIIFASEGAVENLRRASELENHKVKLIVFGSHPHAQAFDEIIRYQADNEVAKFVPRREKDPQKLAAIILTSGSSGVPKGVMYSSKTLAENFVSDMKIKIVLLSYSLLIWTTGFMFLLVSTLTHMTRVLSQRFEPDDMCDIVDKYKVNMTIVMSTMLARLSKFDRLEKYDFQSLNEISIGGAKNTKNVLQTLKNRIPRVNIIQYYGSTEFMGPTFSPLRDPSSHDSIGTILKNVEVKIVDPSSGEALGPKESGELCVRKPNMMMGYYKNAKATGETIVAEGWLHTGDLCYYNENGEIFFVDRLKEIMQYLNHKMTPSEIEEVLITHPAVLEVAVVPIPHELDGEWPMAFVKIREDKKVTEEELIELSLLLGEKKKLRGGVKFLDDLPKTSTGKIARAELKRLARSYGDSSYVW